jgi:hypothetical protein
MLRALETVGASAVIAAWAYQQTATMAAAGSAGLITFIAIKGINYGVNSFYLRVNLAAMSHEFKTTTASCAMAVPVSIYALKALRIVATVPAGMTALGLAGLVGVLALAVFAKVSFQEYLESIQSFLKNAKFKIADKKEVVTEKICIQIGQKFVLDANMPLPAGYRNMAQIRSEIVPRDYQKALVELLNDPEAPYQCLVEPIRCEEVQAASIKISMVEHAVQVERRYAVYITSNLESTVLAGVLTISDQVAPKKASPDEIEIIKQVVSLQMPPKETDE